MQKCILSQGGKVLLNKVRIPLKKSFIGCSKIRPSHSLSKKSFRTLAIEAETIAVSYAAALIDLAEENKTLETIHDDILGLVAILKEDETIREFLYNPVIEIEGKIDIVDSIAKEASFDETTLNFLKVVLESGRFGYIEEICNQFEQEYCRATDTQVATLKSSTKLDADQQFTIAKKLQELTGAKNIKLKPIIDPSLIAGFVVDYGSSRIDMSLKGQLDSITFDLNTAAAEDI